jgi:mono/diheme cytochrome c family protein
MIRLLLAAITLPILSASLAAQNGVPTTTRSGVYDREQALRGQDVYAGNCRSCHTPESHTGQLFNSKWSGKSLLELYAYVRDQMPKNDPGSLSAQEYVEVLAYLLLLNRMPQGDTELPSDTAALRRIRIETSTPVRKEP